MSEPFDPPRLPTSLTKDQSIELSVRAGEVFTPRTPISDRELFAGRWTEINQLVDAVNETGLHVVLYGERGVGKTSLANVVPFVLQYFDSNAKPPRARRIAVRGTAAKADTFSSLWIKILDEITWAEDAPRIGFQASPGKKLVTIREAFGFRGDLEPEVVRRIVSSLPGSVFVIDEFDRLEPEVAAPFTDLIKTLSDHAAPVTLMLVGVAETIEGLVRDHASVTRAIVQVPLKPMRVEDLRNILEIGEKKLGIDFEEAAKQRIAVMSQGRPHYTHQVGLLAVRAAASRLSSRVSAADVTAAFAQAVRAADHTMAAMYAEATASAHSEALWRPVLLACAIAAARDCDQFGYFQPVSVVQPLTRILSRPKPVEIATFNGHLAEFCDEKRGRVMERTGRSRAYRFRFRDPLASPYVLMRGVADGLLRPEDLSALMESPMPNDTGDTPHSAE